MGRKKKTTKRKLAHPTLPMQQRLNLRHEGTHFDLRAIFNDLNQRHFRKRLRGYKVVWGRRRKHRPREQFVFGTIHEEDRMIRINPALDQPFVPLWFLRYVLYHEMLHSVVPDELLSRNHQQVTPKNSIVANANFAIIDEPAAGKTKICRDSCAKPNRV